MPYALFDHDVRIGESASTELGAWQNALRTGLISPTSKAVRFCREASP